jgi:hypothetical protein
MIMNPEIQEVLNSFVTIGLNEMDKVRLMNRTDTKYVLSFKRIPEFLTSLVEDYKVLEIKNERLFPYFTTYLDTIDYRFFNQHITGKLERNKVRYRKYEVTGTTFLEVKKRTNKNRTVKYRIEKELTPEAACDNEALEFLKEYIPQNSLLLRPVLINRFKRATLIGAELNERLTIDYDLSFSKPEGFCVNLPYVAIIELKRNGNKYRSHAANILKSLSVQQTGFSKYCIGTSILYNPPRINIIKPKLLLINKIKNESNKNDCT